MSGSASGRQALRLQVQLNSESLDLLGPPDVAVAGSRAVVVWEHREGVRARRFLVAPPAAIPALGTVGLILLATAVTCTAVRRLRRPTG